MSTELPGPGNPEFTWLPAFRDGEQPGPWSVPLSRPSAPVPIARAGGRGSVRLRGSRTLSIFGRLFSLPQARLSSTFTDRCPHELEFDPKMMQDLREKTKIIMIVVALAFVGLMVFEWGMDISGTSVGQQTGELGRVNNEPIQYNAYLATYQDMYQRAQQGGRQLSREEIRELEDAAFDQVVNEILMRQELRRRGIRVTDEEIRTAALWNPHPDLVDNELFQTEGRFDITKYQAFLSGPAANEELLLQLEQYYREMIPRSKLMRQVSAGAWISDAELWRLFRDRSETATVEYVLLPITQLVPGDVEVSEREVRTHYEANRENFRRTATGRFTVAYIPKAPAPADSAAALQHARAVRAEIAGGADFAEVAARESADQGSAARGGELGTFGRGQMVPSFEEAAFSLPIGQVSEPVASPFGYHLIQVSERQENAVTARHILIPVEASEDAQDALFTRADSLEAMARRGGVQRAARAAGAQTRTGVVVSESDAYVPGVGSLLEAVEWAGEEAGAQDAENVSPLFETEESFYVVETESFTPGGQLTLQQATPEIRRILIQEKKREQARQIGQQMVAEVRGGKPLEQAARERGLAVEPTGPFTRVAFNPVFGQANAAIGAAFGTPIGQVSDVAQTTAGLFIVRPTARTEADRAEFDAQREQLRQGVLFQRQQQHMGRFMEELRRQAEINDRRGEVLRRGV
jgi:peptidyl-prolyl cis-trans isomerase D